MKINPKSVLWIFFAAASYVVIATLLLWVFYGMPVAAKTELKEDLKWEFNIGKDGNDNDYMTAYVTGIGGKKDNAFVISIYPTSKRITGRYTVIMGISLELPKGMRVSPLHPLIRIDGEVIELVVPGVRRETLNFGYLWQFRTNNTAKHLLLTKIRNSKKIEMECMLFPRGEAYFILETDNTDEVIDKLIAYLSKGRAQ